MWPRLGSVSTYSILYSVGILSHFIVSYLLAKSLHLRHRVWIIVSLCYLVGMVIGGKALYDIKQGQFDLQAMFSTTHYLGGGLWSGLLVYICLAVPAVLILTKQRLQALDLVGLSIPIPWIFAKLGCLLNGCCYGKACSLPWAITFPEASRCAPANIPLHPTQIYEMLLMVGIVIFFKTLKYQQWKGMMLLWFFILYGLGRAAIEFFRADLEKDLFVGPFTLSQFICLLAAGISIPLLFLCRRLRVLIILRRQKLADQADK